MGSVTFQIIDGLEAGRVLRDLGTPVTIGREEDNDIRLNDERVSRFHAKIQQDGDKVILTDLESTNGTRVNGHPVRMRLLALGDQIHIGRCVLVYGSPEELNEQISRLRDEAGEAATDTQGELIDPVPVFPDAFPSGPPALPEGLTATQAVELSNLVDFVRTEVLAALYHCTEPPKHETPTYVELSRPAWLRLQKLPLLMAQQLKQLADPLDQERS